MKPTLAEALRIQQRELLAHGYKYTTFMVVGRDHRGKRLRKTFKDRNDAVAFVTGMRTKLLNEETAVRPAMTRMSPTQMRQAESAFERLGRYSLDECVTYFLTNYAAPDETITLDDAIEKFLAGKDDVRSNTLRSVSSTIKRFRDDVGGDVELHAVTSKDVTGFLESLRGKDGQSKATKKTFNNYRNDISSLLTWCMDPQRRWVGKNVALDVPMYDRDQLRKSSTPDTLPVAKACEVMAAAATHQPSLAKAYALMLFAGIRPAEEGELFKLARHPDVDKLVNIRTRTIRIPVECSKVKRLRKIAMSDNLARWLSLPGPILPTNAARHLDAFRPLHDLTPDVCRHSFCTYHVATGGSLADTAMQSGNSETVIRDHYADQVTNDEAAPFWRIIPNDKRGAVIAPEPQPGQPPKKKTAGKK